MDTFKGRLISSLLIFLAVTLMILIILSPFLLGLVISLFSEKIAGIYIMILLGSGLVYFIYLILKDLYKFLKWLIKGNAK